MSKQITVSIKDDVAVNLEKKLENLQTLYGSGVTVSRSDYVSDAIKEKLEREPVKVVP